MHITLDNMFAFLVLLLILVTFMGYIIPTAYLSFTTVKEHQLEEVAQAIMDKILLSPGIPEDWGNIHVVGSENGLKAFGLQKVGGEPYELDVNKILRISSANTSSIMTLPRFVRISVDTIARLLGLGNDYGFSIRITPALNMSASVSRYETFTKGNGQGHGDLDFPVEIEVTVTTPEKRPAIGANVTGLLIFAGFRGHGQQEECFVDSYSATGVTDSTGKAKLNFTGFMRSVEDKWPQGNVLRSSAYTIVIYADYYGIRAIGSPFFKTDASERINGTIVDNYLILEYEGKLDFPSPPAAVFLERVAALASPPYYVYLSDFENVTDHGESGQIINSGHYNIRVYELRNVVDDDVSLILLPVWCVGPPREYGMVSFFREPSNVVCQKGAAHGNIKTSVLRRMVKVGSFHYFFEVSVWRWGE